MSSCRDCCCDLSAMALRCPACGSAIRNWKALTIYLMSLVILAGVGVALFAQIPKERPVQSTPRVGRLDHHQRDHEAAAEAIVKRLKAERGTKEVECPFPN